MCGKLYCIGVGPGDPELMTIKALRALSEADVVAYPHSDKAGSEAVALGIATAACEELKNKEKLPVYVPMTRDRDAVEKSLREVAEQISERLKGGKSVAYVTLGDPMIYSTYSTLGKTLRDLGHETIYVPGVPSFCAAAAKLGVPLAEGKEALSIIPASGAIPSLRENENAVFMKAGSRMKELKECDALKNREVMAVSNCGMENEAVYERMSDVPEDAGYFTIVMAKKKLKSRMHDNCP